jgi:hypothetical protein
VAIHGVIAANVCFWLRATCHNGLLPTDSCPFVTYQCTVMLLRTGKHHPSGQKTAYPQSRRDEDQMFNHEEIKHLRRQSILPLKPKPQ